MKPHNRHQRAKLSWHCHQLKGEFCQICQALFAIETSPVSGGFWLSAKMSGNMALK